MGGGTRRLSFKQDFLWGFKWDAFQEDEVEDTDTAADEVPSVIVNEDDEDAFREDEWKRKQPDSTTSG